MYCWFSLLNDCFSIGSGSKFGFLGTRNLRLSLHSLKGSIWWDCIVFNWLDIRNELLVHALGQVVLIGLPEPSLAKPRQVRFCDGDEVVSAAGADDESVKVVLIYYSSVRFHVLYVEGLQWWCSLVDRQGLLCDGDYDFKLGVEVRDIREQEHDL